jgi:hypothetical protein
VCTSSAIFSISLRGFTFLPDISGFATQACVGVSGEVLVQRGTYLCDWSCTTFFFVKSIVEKVVRTVKSDSCSYHVMVDCFFTGLFGHLHITLLDVGEIFSILWVTKV